MKTKKQTTEAQIKKLRSDISFMNHTDEGIDTSETEEEDGIEFMKISTAIAVENSNNPMLD